MGLALFALSVLALAGAGVLWRADAGAKKAARAAKPAQPVEGAAPGSPEPAAAEAAVPVAAEPGAVPEPPAEPTVPEAAAQPSEPAPAAEPAEAVQPPLGPDTEPEQEQEPVAEPAASEVPEPAPEPEAEPAAKKASTRWKLPKLGKAAKAVKASKPGKSDASAEPAETDPAAQEKSTTPEKPKPRTPKNRKAWREWAEENGFTYAKEDEFLADEWTRGAALSGVVLKDVLTGTRFGHETRIADIAGTPVVAMGTGMPSDVVVDMRRGVEGPADDLVKVSELEGFTVLASDAGPVERMIDIRVQTAVEMLPAQVTAVWFETEWVIAQLDEPEWDDVFAPLALLADAARTLPPQTWPTLKVASPSREMGEPQMPTAAQPQEPEEPSRPHVVRPEDPVEMPTRLTGGARGPIEDHEVGSDEVNAIATGERRRMLNDGTRVTRKPLPPSIFRDGGSESER